MKMISFVSNHEPDPITEETIYTDSYVKLQEHYFQELAESAQELESPTRGNILGKSFFIFENKKDEVDKSEKKDGKEYMDSLLYFYPEDILAEDYQQRLVGIIQAFIIQTKENSTPDDLPEVIGFTDCKIGLCYYAEFVFALGFAVEIPDKLIKFQLEKLHEGLVFFNGVFQKRRDELDLEYKNIVRIIGKEMSVFYQKLNSNSLCIFRSLPFYQLPYKNNSIFIYASQFLDSLCDDKDFLGGTILYDNQIICNNVNEDVLYWVVYKSNNLNLFTNSVMEENLEKDIFFKNFGETKREISVNSEIEERQVEIQIEEAEETQFDEGEGDRSFDEKINGNWFISNINTSYRRKTQNIKKLFKSKVNRVHGQMIFGKNDISDFSLVFIPGEKLKSLREEFSSGDRKIDEGKRKGEFILMVIEQLESIRLVRLFEVKKFEQRNLFQKSTRDKLLGLKVKIDETLHFNSPDEKKYINKNGMKMLLNDEGKKEKVLIYEKNDKNLTGNFYQRNKSFVKLHHLLKDEGVTKIILKQNDKMYYAKNIFDTHVFYELDTKEGIDGNEEKKDLNIVEFENRVKKKVREGFKMNLL